MNDSDVAITMKHIKSKCEWKISMQTGEKPHDGKVE